MTTTIWGSCQDKPAFLVVNIEHPNCCRLTSIQRVKYIVLRRESKTGEPSWSSVLMTSGRSSGLLNFCKRAAAEFDFAALPRLLLVREEPSEFNLSVM